MSACTMAAWALVVAILVVPRLYLSRVRREVRQMEVCNEWVRREIVALKEEERTDQRCEPWTGSRSTDDVGR
jgi:hypothetical protein